MNRSFTIFISPSTLYSNHFITRPFIPHEISAKLSLKLHDILHFRFSDIYWYPINLHSAVIISSYPYDKIDSVKLFLFINCLCNLHHFFSWHLYKAVCFVLLISLSSFHCALNMYYKFVSKEGFKWFVLKPWMVNYEH